MEKDYKKMYEDALKRAMNLALTNNISALAASEIFPELNESEDEKIMKGLIEHLKELKEQSVGGSYLKRPEHYDAWIAWVEKHKKDEPVFTELCESEDEKIMKDLKFYLEVRRCHTNDDEEYISCNKFLSWLEKKDKKLHVEWNEKTKGLDELETYILSLDPNRSLDAVKVDAKNVRFLVNKDENKYEKGFNDGFSASEYNRKMTEEDIRHINNIIGFLEEFINPGFPIYKGGVFKEIKWLENLKNNK